MTKQLHILLTLLLAMIFTSGGAKEVTYTVTSTKAVSTSGTAPTGSSATYSSTYTTSCQLISGKKMTLTLSGYAGKKITGLTLSMHSNANKGAGYLDAKIGTKTFASLGSSTSGVTFNKWYDNTKYSSQYNDVTVGVTATAVEDNEDIVIVIGATTNSLYCQSIKLTYEDVTDTPSADISFNEKSYTAYLGTTFNAPVLNNPNNVNVSYTSSKEDVATVDASTGAVTLVGTGTTTITASYNDENGDYANTTASYSLKVINPNEIIFSEEGYKNSDYVTTITKNDFTATFSKNSGKSTPSYFDTGTAVRMYQGNTLTISSTTKEISKIEFTFDTSGKTNYSNLSLGEGQTGTYTSGTWTGLSNSVTFINGITQSRIQSIIVTLEEGSPETYTASTLALEAQAGDAYYATFSSDKVTFFTTDVDVNTVVAENGSLTMLTGKDGVFTERTATIEGKEISGYYIPANTGVLIYALENSATYYTVSGKTVDAVDESFNMLRPASTTMTGDYYFYKLAYNDYDAKTGLGFYWGAADGAAFTAKAGGAYLAVPKTASAKGFYLFNNETTGINTINSNVKANNNAVYNLRGQRVNANYKGIVIVNGKKFINK